MGGKERLSDLPAEETPREQLERKAAEMEKTFDGPVSSKIDFGSLYRVKGYQNLHAPSTASNRSGMVRMEDWVTGEQSWVKVADTIGITSYKIATTDSPEGIRLRQAFDNIWTSRGGQAITPDKPLTFEEVTPVYDPELLKKHHLRQLTKWYNQIVIRMNLIFPESDDSTNDQTESKVEA